MITLSSCEWSTISSLELSVINRLVKLESLGFIHYTEQNDERILKKCGISGSYGRIRSSDWQLVKIHVLID